MSCRALAAALFLLGPFTANAQDSSIYVQCPATTDLHPGGGPEIRCIHLAAGDGMVTMADDQEKPLYIFSFSELPLPGEGSAPTDPSLYANYVMDYGLLSANAPAPTISVDEDDELYLQVTNVGMALRPDLSDPHTVHWHGFPNASAEGCRHLHVPLPRRGHRAHADGHARQPLRTAAAEPASGWDHVGNAYA
jgi:hypothetical protein